MDKKEYQKQYHKKWYEENKVARRKAIAERKAQTKALATEFVDGYKLGKGCADCGYNKHAIALDFDHLGDKLYNVSKMVADGLNLDRIKEEIAKCEVVCANCHRVRTKSRRL